jgi:hypothetical protein
MCFSAEASFIAGTALSVVGVVAIKKTVNPSQIAFASIPLIFAIQQFSEGFLWLALLSPTYAFLQKITTYTFLTFAQVVWPTWVSFSILLLERDNKRKRMLYAILSIGVLVSLCLTYRLLTQTISSRIGDHHIIYDFGTPMRAIKYFSIFYFISTVVPPFVSGIKKMWYLGFIILASYLATEIFFKKAVISVWCFFAAVISIAVLSIIVHIGKKRITDATKTV